MAEQLIQKTGQSEGNHLLTLARLEGVGKKRSFLPERVNRSWQ